MSRGEGNIVLRKGFVGFRGSAIWVPSLGFEGVRFAVRVVGSRFQIWGLQVVWVQGFRVHWLGFWGFMIYVRWLEVASLRFRMQDLASDLVLVCG